MTSPKKPGVAFWASVVVVVGLIGYPLSFGPWCWIASRTAAHVCDVPRFYRPITFFAESSTAASTVIEWYANALAADEWELYDDGDGWSMSDNFGGML